MFEVLDLLYENIKESVLYQGGSEGKMTVCNSCENKQLECLWCHDGVVAVLMSHRLNG